MVTLDKQVIITKQYIIQSYEIFYVNLKLIESASIYIMIFFNDTETVERSFFLIGDEYSKWINDDYLYTYINDNIEKIFNN